VDALERSPAGAKTSCDAISLCMLDEFSIPLGLIDSHVTRMRVLSLFNLATDFSRAIPLAHTSPCSVV
jgi:geranylgeranyl reductase